MSSAGREVLFIGMKLRGGEQGRYHPLRGTGTLTVEESRLTLRGTYDPPGSVWLALLLTFVTFGLVHASVAAQWVPMAAGPGFLPWYLAVRAMRKQKLELPLGADAITEAVLDPTSTLLAVRVSGQAGQAGLPDGWLGLGLTAPEAVVPALKAQWGGKLRQGAVKKGISSIVLIICLILLFVMMIGVMGVVAASGMSKYKAQAQSAQLRIKLRQVQQAAVQWYVDKASCPSLSDLAAVLPAEFRPNDTWGEPLRLLCEGSQVSVRSAGPDRKFDTPDDIATPDGP